MANAAMPIAVIGMSCRFPDDADNIENFWDFLVRGRSSSRKVPEERFSIDSYYHPSSSRQGSIQATKAHFLKQHAAEFDAPFFSMTKGEADATDPQQRLLLEVAYEAFENAGVPTSKLAGSRTSVYSSCFVTDYTQISSFDSQHRSLHESTGHSSALVSNRVSWFFDLRGPSMTIDTGCSGSTVAFHLACESLRSGEATSALACGVNLLLAPDPFIGMSSFNFLGLDGISYSFDHRANGYSRGEGFAAVLLKPLDAAIRDRDNIRAVVRSSSVAQDGRTPGLTLPSREAQASLIRHTYARAGLDYAQTAFFEAHGTGTVAGDAAELGAIGDVFSSTRTPEQKMIVGAVKTNIGHLEGCAGLAGIIKAILALERSQIPANLNFQKPRPENDLEKYRVEIPTSFMPWPVSGIRRASINCFGFGGTIAHVIIDDASSACELPKWPVNPTACGGFDRPLQQGSNTAKRPSAALTPSDSGSDLELQSAEKRQKTYQACDDSAVALSLSEPPKLMVLSAPDQQAVARLADGLGAYLQGVTGDDNSNSVLINLAYTLNERRSRFAWRKAIIGGSVAEVKQALSNSNAKPTQALEICRLCFVFTGQGAQWAKMGLELCRYPAFYRSLREADVYIQSLGADWSVLKELDRDSKLTSINDPDKSQSLCTILQTALVDLLGTWNVTPTAVIGHSSGEIAAAYCAGAIARHDAWRLAYYRGRASLLAPHGAMLAIGSSAETVLAHIVSLGLDEKLDIACFNSHSNVTVSGGIGAVDSLSAALDEAGIFNRKLQVKVAYHSKFMSEPAEQYLEAVRDLVPTTDDLKCRMFSSVTGKELKPNELDGRYFVENLKSPVQFSAAVASALKACNSDAILEVGPHAVLKSAIKETVAAQGLVLPTYASTLIRNDDATKTTLGAVGKLWTLGYDVNLARVNDPTATNLAQCISDLPPYPWNHTRKYWFESERSKTHRERRYPRHDLLGSFDLAANNINMCWRNLINPKELPWVKDHQVQGVTLYPAAGMLCMVLEAARQFAIDQQTIRGFELHDVEIDKAMVIPETGQGLETSLSVSPKEVGGDWYEFAICSREGESPFQRNCKGSLLVCRKDSVSGNERGSMKSDVTVPHSTVELSPQKYYQKLSALGMTWGPTFQNLTKAEQEGNLCAFEVKVPDTAAVMPANYETPQLIHPATLDAMFHAVVFSAIQSGGTPKVPNAIDYVYISNELPHAPGSLLCGRTSIVDSGLRCLTAKIQIQAEGRSTAAIVIEGLRCTDVGSSGGEIDGESGTALCSKAIWREDVDLLSTEQLTRMDTQLILDLAAYKDPNLQILEINDGTFEPTHASLKTLTTDSAAPRMGKYTVTMTTKSAFKEAKVQMKDYEAILDFRELDIGLSVLDQGFTEASCDLVIVPDIEQSVGNVDMLLKPGGLMLSYNGTVKRKTISPSAKQDLILIHAEQSSTLDHILAPMQAALDGMFNITLCTAASAEETGIADQQLILFALDLDQLGVASWSEATYTHIKQLLLRSRRAMWLTHGAISAVSRLDNPGAASILGFFRSLRFEDSRLKLHSVDVPTNATKTVVNGIAQVMGSIVYDQRYDLEYEFAVRDDGTVLIPRVLPDEEMIRTVAGLVEDTDLKNFVQEKRLSAVIRKTGDLDSLVWEECRDESPLAAHQVEIQVLASALVHFDTATVLGQTSTTTLGSSVAGRVLAVGSEVLSVQQDQHVATFVAGALQNSIRCPAELVQVIPDYMSSEVAAAVTKDWTTAQHALYGIARIEAGEKCLVLAASSILGKAAMSLARRAGADLYATVQTEAEKRVLIKEVGLEPDKVFTSVHGDIAWDVIISTNQDIDIAPYWQQIADFGRFVQITSGSNKTKKSAAKGFIPHESATFSTVDIELLRQRKPQLCARAMRDAFAILGCERIDQPTVMPCSRLGDALKEIAQPDKNTTVVVLQATEHDLVPVIHADIQPLEAHLHSKATYIIVGGLGGLGRSIATFMVEHGAKHIVFLSRSGARRGSGEEKFLTQLKIMGASTASAFACDIADEKTLRKVIGGMKKLPPIRGVIHAAMVLRDCLCENMTYEEFQEALRPKIQGTWNLHNLLPKDLDFFVMLSSIAGVGGMRGQTNYAAGNSFQDAFADYRRSLGMPAVAIDLTVVLGIGVVAENPELLDGLKQAGVLTIQEEEMLQLIKAGITGYSRREARTPSQTIVGVATGGYLDRHDVQDSMWPNDNRFRHTLKMGREGMRDGANGRADGVVKLNSALPAAKSLQEATGLVIEALVGRLAKALAVSTEDIDEGKCVSDYGVDSLIAVELRNWIQRQARAAVSVFDLMSQISIRQLGAKIVGESSLVKASLKTPVGH